MATPKTTAPTTSSSSSSSSFSSSAFQIPSEYAGFVSSSAELLEQLTGDGHNQLDADTVQYRIYLDECLLHIDDVARQCAMLHELSSTIKKILKDDISGYIWHSDAFDVDITYPISRSPQSDTLLYLKGRTHFGENIDDEWFIVYLLMKLSKQLPNISVRVSDSDGEFLLIEAADYLEDWLSPDNATNRIWIRHGALHALPLDLVPCRPLEHLSTVRALSVLVDAHDCSSSSQSSVPLTSCLSLSNGVQRIISARTTNIFPQRSVALRHIAAAILPLWVSQAFTAEPALIASAVRCFAQFEATQLSQTLNSISLPFVGSSPTRSVCGSQSLSAHTIKLMQDQQSDRLCSVTIPMTRTLFALLTFKQFKLPRKYHSLQRRLAACRSFGQSSRINTALTLGCRLTAGLELYYLECSQQWADFQQYELEKREILLKAMEADGIKVESNANSPLLQCVVDMEPSLKRDHHPIAPTAKKESDVESDVKEHMDMLCGLQSRRRRYQQLVEVMSTMASSQNLTASLTESQLQQWADHCAQDDDNVCVQASKLSADDENWLHLSPDQLDKEMESRMRHAAAEMNSAEELLGGNVTETNTEANPNSNSEKNPSTDETESEVQRLQSIVDDFKQFLSGVSEYDGVQLNAEASQQSDQTSRNNRTEKNHRENSFLELDKSSFDVAYLEATLGSCGLRLDGSAVDSSLSNDQAQAHTQAEARIPVSNAMTGVSLKVLTATQSSGLALQLSVQADSDDEEVDARDSCPKDQHTVSTNKDNDASDEDDDDEDVDSDFDSDNDWENDRSGPFDDGDDDNDGSAEDIEKLRSALQQMGIDPDALRDLANLDGGDESTEFSMEDFQRAMDSQLFGEQALKSTFADFAVERDQKESEEEEDDFFHSNDSIDIDGMSDEQMDAHLLMNMMQAHAEGLGAPAGPVHQLLAQLGRSLPIPPPAN